MSVKGSNKSDLQGSPFSPETNHSMPAPEQTTATEPPEKKDGDTQTNGQKDFKPPPPLLEEELKERFDILLGLWHYPNIERAHFTGTNEYSKKLENEMQLHTNRWFLLTLLLTIFIGMLYELEIIKAAFWIMLYIVLCFSMSHLGLQLLVRHNKRKFGQLSGVVDYKKSLWDCFKLDINGIRQQADRKNPVYTQYRKWKSLVLVNMFGYRFVWWWTLIVGIVATYLKCIGGEDNAGDVFGSSEFSSGLIIAITTAVFTFIATNVIHELVLVRDGYRKTRGKMTEVSNQISKSKQELYELTNEVKDGLEDAKSVHLSSLSLLRYGGKKDRLNSFFDDKDDMYHRLRTQKNSLLENIANQASNFIDQIENLNKTNIDRSICIAATINQYIKTERGLLNGQQKHLLTTYAGLGSIAGNIVHSIYPGHDKKNFSFETGKQEVAFYGMMQISPKEFIVGPNGGGADPTDWQEKFLKKNYEAANTIEQERLFFSIKDDHRHPLYSEIIISQLGKKVIVDEEGVSRLCHQRKKDCQSCNDQNNCCSTGEAIYSKYHKKCAYICELTKKEYEDLFVVKLMGRDQHIILLQDYFSVKIGNKWSYCLKSLYNEEMDYAKIEIYHDGMSDELLTKWDSLKNGNLNKIYSLDKIPINEYS